MCLRGHTGSRHQIERSAKSRGLHPVAHRTPITRVMFASPTIRATRRIVLDLRSVQRRILMSVVRVPHPIPYQGSKRQLASAILSYFPGLVGRLVEPFAGSAAVSLWACHIRQAERVWLNDINSPLIDLWRSILDSPEELAESYEEIWDAQHKDPRAFYNQIRMEFNKA